MISITYEVNCDYCQSQVRFGSYTINANMGPPVLPYFGAVDKNVACDECLKIAMDAINEHFRKMKKVPPVKEIDT